MDEVRVMLRVEVSEGTHNVLERLAQKWKVPISKVVEMLVDIQLRLQ